MQTRAKSPRIAENALLKAASEKNSFPIVTNVLGIPVSRSTLWKKATVFITKQACGKIVCSCKSGGFRNSWKTSAKNTPVRFAEALFRFMTKCAANAARNANDRFSSRPQIIAPFLIFPFPPRQKKFYYVKGRAKIPVLLCILE